MRPSHKGETTQGWSWAARRELLNLKMNFSMDSEALPIIQRHIRKAEAATQSFASQGHKGNCGIVAPHHANAL